MTTQEFSTEFDVLFNNITSNQAPGLNNYEKSVFLTKAEKQLVHEYFNHRTDVQGGGFDGSIRRQIDFSSITDTVTLLPMLPVNYTYIDNRAIVFPMSSLTKVVCILNESVDFIGSENNIETYTVIPLSFDEYQRLMMKPYKYPTKGQVWRLMNHNFIEIVGKNNIQNVRYRMRYVRMPHPIILEDLSNLDVSIDNETAITECELPEELHQEILERAVTLAKIAWQGTTMTQTALAVEASK